MTQIKLATYNILMGGRNGAPLHAVVREMAPRVLLVNESPKRVFLWRRQCERLAQIWGMRFVDGGRPAGSNMIVVAPGVHVANHGAEVLPQPRFQPRRGIAWAQLELEGRPFAVVSCHLSLDQERRLNEVDRVLTVAKSLSGPIVVAGDLNEPPSGPAWRALEDAGFQDHGSSEWKTFPAPSPTKRIDALLVRGELDVISHGDPGVSEKELAAGSDHRPVLAVLEIPWKPAAGSSL